MSNQPLSLLSGPQDVSTLTATINTLINQLNAMVGGTPAVSITADSVNASTSITTTNPATFRDVVGKTSATFAGAVTAGSGNGSLVGTRGEFAAGNAATVLGAGYYYGAQGKVTEVTGATIGAGAHAFGVVGQFDLSLGHVSGDPQISAVWGDMGATASADGWGVNSSILSGQNTTASAVNSHLYTYGKASYWNVIASNSSACVASATGGLTPSGNAVKLKVNVDGADYYVLAAATYS